MAVTHKATIQDTSNTTLYTSAAFTPVAGDLLVAFICTRGSTAADSTVTTSAGIAFTKVFDQTNFPGGYVYIANALATAVSQTFSFACPSDQSTGTMAFICAVTGVPNLGLAASRQSKGASKLASVTPEAIFDVAPLTVNPVIAFCSTNGTATPFVVPPAGFTELTEGIEATLGQIEYAAILSAAPQTVTWGSAPANSTNMVVIELNATLQGAGKAMHHSKIRRAA